MSSPATADLVGRLQALCEVLEDALVRQAPDRGPPWAASMIEAVDRFGRAAGAPEPERQLELLDQGVASLRDAGEAEEKPEGVETTIEDAIGFAAQIRARVLEVAAMVPLRPASPEPVPPLRASIGEPQVLPDLALPELDLLPREAAFDPAAVATRELATASVHIEQVRRWLESEDDEDDERRVPPMREEAFGPARGTPLELVQLGRIARDCLEDIGVLGGLRRPEPDLPWSFAERFEERLCANLDAFVALDSPRVPGGPRLGVARELWSYVREWNVPDQGRAFAFAFVLACAADDAGPRWAALTMRRAAPRLLRSFEDAFALGSSPHVAPALAAVLQVETSPAVLSTALRALRRRGPIDPTVALPLVAHPQLAVAREAIASLGDAPTDTAAAALPELLGGDPTAAAEAAFALARLGERRGLLHLRALLTDGSADPSLEDARVIAARAIALLGDPRDAESLVAVCERSPREAELLGWHGHAVHIPLLLAGLSRPDDHERRSAGWGLTRVLGSPSGRSTSQGPILDPSVWRDHLAQAPVAPGKRWQSAQIAAAGAATVPRLAAELGAATTLHRDRSVLRLELELALGRPLPFDLDGWVTRQRTILDAVRAL